MRAIQTARLHLRPMTVADEALYCRLYTDPAVMRLIAAPLSASDALAHFRAALSQQGDKRLLWVVEVRGGNADVGLLGVSSSKRSAEVGVMLFAQAQSKGFAAEALTAVHGILYREYAFEQIWTRHASANAHARGLMLKLGYLPLGGDLEPAGSLPRWEMTKARWHSLSGLAVADVAR